MSETFLKHRRHLTLDALRGLLMILMAVDHTSFFVAKIHPYEVWYLPLPDYPNALAFWTRYVTHLCAPGFSFLLGVGIVLFAQRRLQEGWTHARVSRQLAMRGLALILLEQLLDNTAWLLGGLTADVPIEGYRAETPPVGDNSVWIGTGVLFELGAALILWGVLLRIGTFLLIILGFLAIGVSHELTLAAAPVASLASSWRVLFMAGHFGIVGTGYPPLPWAAIAGFGMAFGRLLLRDEARAFRTAGILGLILTLLFVWMRGSGLGDPHPATGAGWIDFLRVTKYPPSPAFIVLTIGANLLLLHAFSHGSGLLARLSPLLIFGQTALFFYFAHTWLYLLIGFVFPAGLGLPSVYPMLVPELRLGNPVREAPASRLHHQARITSMWQPVVCHRARPTQPPASFATFKTPPG